MQRFNTEVTEMLRALRVEGLMATEYTEPGLGDDTLSRPFMLNECARCEELHAERTDGTGFRTAGGKTL